MNFLPVAGSGDEENLLTQAEDAAELMQEAVTDIEEVKSGSI